MFKLPLLFGAIAAVALAAVSMSKASVTPSANDAKPSKLPGQGSVKATPKGITPDLVKRQAMELLRLIPGVKVSGHYEIVKDGDYV